MRDIINCGGGIVVKCSDAPQAGLLNFCQGKFYGYDGVGNIPLTITDSEFNTCLNNVCTTTLQVCGNYRFQYDPITGTMDLVKTV